MEVTFAKEYSAILKDLLHHSGLTHHSVYQVYDKIFIIISFRLTVGGSTLLAAETSSLMLRTGLSFPVTLHLTSRLRSYFQLQISDA